MAKLTSKQPPRARPLLILGAGGHGLEAAEIAARMSAVTGAVRWNVLGVLDDNPAVRGKKLGGLPVLGGVGDFLEKHHGPTLWFHAAFGDNLARQKVTEAYVRRGFHPATLVDPSALLSPAAVVGEGVYVAAHCYVGPEARLGSGVLINVGASIGHHAVLGEFAQVCPGARVSGHCEIGALGFLGSNAVLHPRVRVGEGAKVAAGSFAVRDVPARTSVLGVPAREVAADEVPRYPARPVI